MASDKKKQMVEGLTKLAQQYPIVGVIDMQNLPAPQLQQLRKALRGKVEMRMARRRLIHMALEQAGKGVEKLIPSLGGMSAVLFTKENPFKLYKIVQKNKSRAPAKAGQVAPQDIIIPAGPTPFAPGPVIGELGAAGLKTGVEAGKVVIKQDAVVCRKGQEITSKIAELLKRFSIEPMEIGLNITAVVEKGVVFTADQLSIDDDAFAAQLMDAINSARNVAVEVAYPSIDVVELLVQKAFREAKAVALEFNIVGKDVVEEIIGKGEREALALQSTIGNI